MQAKMKKGLQSHNISLMACLLNAVTEGQYFAHEIEHMLLSEDLFVQSPKSRS